MPLKTYSSGMKARLGFAISIFTKPDIILLDEVFSVGDANFKNKSSKKMIELMDSGKTVIITSHSENQIKSLCSRVIYIKDGKIKFDGDVKKGLEIYKKGV